MIPFNKPFRSGLEFEYMADAVARGKLSGDGHYTSLASGLLENMYKANRVLLTHSCTAALEMAALLCEIKSGDEIIMPSYTFVSSANAFVLRGGVPVFIDIRPDTLNIDETQIEEAITENTKAILVVHYAGIPCEMDVIMAIARKHNLYVIEDAAQAIASHYQGKQLGTIGHLGTFSFHETKNIISGEGGALLVNDLNMIERAEIIREKGTDRSKFFRGEVDKYTWQAIGSSFLPSELNSAYLYAQLENIADIQNLRFNAWNRYRSAFLDANLTGNENVKFMNPVGDHNAHMFYLLLSDVAERERFRLKLQENKINAVTHYVPLHSSPAGLKYGRSSSKMKVTNEVSESIIRLPLFCEIDNVQDEVITSVLNSLNV